MHTTEPENRETLHDEIATRRAKELSDSRGNCEVSMRECRTAINNLGVSVAISSEFVSRWLFVMRHPSGFESVCEIPISDETDDMFAEYDTQECRETFSRHWEITCACHGNPLPPFEGTEEREAPARSEARSEVEADFSDDLSKQIANGDIETTRKNVNIDEVLANIDAALSDRGQLQ